MAVLKLGPFGGMWPLRSARALPDNVAVAATNVRTDGTGTLHGVKALHAVKTVAAGTRSVFRIPGTPSDPSTGFFMEFTDPDTDVVRTPIVNDGFRRLYWCSPSTGLRYNTETRILAGTTHYDLGVPAPATTITAQPVAGTGAIVNGKNTGRPVTRSYMVTFVNIFGEEGQPSNPVEVNGFNDQTYLLGSFPAAPTGVNSAPIAKWRVYRTITASSGATTFFKVVDINYVNPVGFTYQDTSLDSSLITQIESVNWAAPPAMDGIVAMPNGIIAGWKGNTVYFSENYRPHAWPAEYAVTVQYPIVGLGVYGSTLVVCTTGFPATISGVKSNTMSLNETRIPMPCLSRRSIVSMPEGVYFATTEGLVLVSANGPAVITKDLIGRDRWNTVYTPSAICAAVYEGGYFAIQRGQSLRGFMLRMPEDGAVVHLDPALTGDIDVVQDVWSGRPLLINGTTVYEYGRPASPDVECTWRSKEFQSPQPFNLGAFQVFYDESVSPIGGGAPVRFRVWAYLLGNTGETVRTLVFDQDYTRSGSTRRLPSGFVSDIWQFEIVARVPVHGVVVASSVTELRNG